MTVPDGQDIDELLAYLDTICSIMATEISNSGWFDFQHHECQNPVSVCQDGDEPAAHGYACSKYCNHHWSQENSLIFLKGSNLHLLVLAGNTSAGL